MTATNDTLGHLLIVNKARALIGQRDVGPDYSAGDILADSLHYQAENSWARELAAELGLSRELARSHVAADPRPCSCGGRVALISGICEACDALNLRAQLGPQSDFLACDAKVALFGGAAGGGKSHGLLLDAFNRGFDTPGWAGLVLRRHQKDLHGPGTIFERAKALFGPTGARIREGNTYDITWPGGGQLVFKHLEGANFEDYQGHEYAWVGLDEATHFELSWVMYMLTRVRTTCDVPSVMRMTCNPDPDHPLRAWVDPYLYGESAPVPGDDGLADPSESGRIRYWQVSRMTDKIIFADTRAEAAELTGREPRDMKTFAFIPSKLGDNPALAAAEPEYRSSLALHGAVTERRLGPGDWNAKPVLTGMLRLLLERIVDKPLGPIVKRSRGWDKAGTEPRADAANPDYSVGVQLLWDDDGRWYFADLAVCRKEPPGVFAMLRNTAALDGPTVAHGIFRDPAQAGKVDAEYTREIMYKQSRCGEVTILPVGNQLNQKVINAKPLAEDLAQGRGYILAGPWLEAEYDDGGDGPRTIMGLIRSQVGAFPSDAKQAKDDIVDGLSAAHAVGKTMRIVQGDRSQTMADARALLRERARGGRH